MPPPPPRSARTFTFFAYDLPATVAAIRQATRLAYQSTAGFAATTCNAPTTFSGHLDCKATSPRPT